MISDNTRKRSASHGILAILVTVLLGQLSATAMAAKDADPYLSAINAEGNRLESLGKAKQEEEALLREEKRSASAPATARPKTTTTANVSQQQFEDALRQSFPGSYALYNLMDSGEKKDVFVEYNKRHVDGPARFIPAVKKIIAITSASSENRARALDKK